MKKMGCYRRPDEDLFEKGIDKAQKPADMSVIFLDALWRVGLLRAMRNLCFLLSALLLFVMGGGYPASASPQIVQTFYVPILESQIRAWEVGLTSTTGTPITDTTAESVISITATMDGTIIYYDQWEDGYEADITNPQQSTTQIWGDGQWHASGTLPGAGCVLGAANCPSAGNCPCNTIKAGTVIPLQSSIPANPRDQGNIFFDGGDKIAATGQLVITRVGWLTPTGTVLSGAVEVQDTRKWATSFIVPIGTDSSTTYPTVVGNMFTYTALSIMAQSDNTTVTVVDRNNNPVGASPYTLTQGGSVYISGITYGTQITSSSPIQVDMMTGDSSNGVTYEGRWFTLLPESQWSSSYYNPVPTVVDTHNGNTTHTATVLFYNPNSSSITVYVAYNGGNTTVPVAANSIAHYQMPQSTGAQFYTTGNPAPNFFAVFLNDYNSPTYEWAAMMVPATSLTPSVVVGWAPGSDPTVTPLQNVDVVWVTPTANTTLYVNYSGNPNFGALTDTYGNKYDVAYAVNALQSQKISNPNTSNMTGARIYTVDGTRIAAFYGEDGSTGVTGSPGMDIGTAVLPYPTLTVYKTAALIGDYNANGGIDPGELMQYTIRVHNSGIFPITNVVVTDTLDPNVTYVADTTGYSSSQSGPFIPVADNPFGVFPLLNGFTVVSSPAELSPGQDTYLQFQVTVNNPLNPTTATTLLNTVQATSTSLQNLTTINEMFTNLLSSTIEQGALTTAKTAAKVNGTAVSAGATVKPGDIITYNVTVTNNSTTAQTGITLTDPLPAGTTYVANSTSVTGHLQTYVLDMFNQLSYGNNNGPQNWNGNWIENDAAGNSQDPLTGNVQVTNGSLRLAVSGSYAYRQANLITGISGQSYTSATLSFNYRTNPTFGTATTADTVVIEISGDGSTFITVATFTGVNSTGIFGETSGTGNYNITNASLISATTTVRFRVTSSGGATNYFYATDVALKTNELPGTVTKTNQSTGSGYLTNGSLPSLVVSGDGFALAPGDTLSVTYNLQVSNPPNATRVTNSVQTTSHEQSQPAASTTINPINQGGAVGGLVWIDSIVNGVYDAGEPVLSGIRVWVDTNGNGVYDPGVDLQTLTGTNGEYLFTGLPAGTYRIYIDATTLPTGLTITTNNTNPNPATGNAPLTITTNGEQFLNINFGFENGTSNTAVIGSYVWSDANDNGIMDNGEVGLGSVTLQLLTSPGGTVVATTTTNAYGTYLFANVAPGTYTIKVTNPPNGYTLTTGAQSVGTNPSSPLSVTGGNTYVMMNFGYYNASTYALSDRIWFDLNGNGLLDSGELGIAGVTVSLLNSSNAVIGTTTTDVYGDFIFPGVPNGSYTIQITDTNGKLIGYSGTTTSAQNKQLAITVSGANVSGTDFGYNAPGKIGYRVWMDSNGNGLQDAGENGISGVTVKLYLDTNGNGVLDLAGSNADQLVATTTTDSNGNYMFQVTQPGIYFVSIDPTAGNNPTLLNGLLLTTTDDQPAAGYQHTVKLYTLATSDMTANFGFGSGGLIGANVWNDLNENGIKDSNEAGIPNVAVQLYKSATNSSTYNPASDTLVSTTTTNSAGSYSFNLAQLGTGTGYYFVRVDNTQSALAIMTLTTTNSQTAPGVWQTVDVTSLTADYLSANFGFVTPTSNFTITKTASPAGAVSSGATITYTITIQNNSTTTTQTGIAVNDPLPTNTSYVSGTAMVTKGYTYASTNSTLTADADTYIVQNAATRSYGATSPLHIYYSSGGTTENRALVHFPISLPSGSIVNSATMQFTVQAANANITENLYRLTQSWVEGTSANPCTNGATWNTFNCTNSWAKAGGDYDSSTLIGSFAPAAANTTYTVSYPALTSLVSNWVSGNMPNDGVILIAASTSGTNQNSAVYSREYGTAADRPQLTINYAYPNSVTNKAPTVTYPSGSTLVSSSDGFILPPGQSMTITYQVTVGSASNITQLTNVATVSSSQTASATASVTNPMSYSTDLQVTKAVQSLNAPCYAGTCQVTYLMTLKNVGNGNVNSAQVTDILPSGLTYSSSVPSSGTYNSSTGIWNIPTAIASGSSVTLTLTATVQQLGSPIQNCANLTASSPADGNSANNSSCVSITPTQVSLSDFRSYKDKDKVIVQWTTASEMNTIGFYLYRLDESTGKYRRLNQRLLPGLLTSIQGGTYSLIDTGASVDTNTYVLMEVENNGTANSYGPFTVSVGGPNAVTNHAVSTAMLAQPLMNNAIAIRSQTQSNVPAEDIAQYTDQNGSIVVTNVTGLRTSGDIGTVDLFSDYTRRANQGAKARAYRAQADSALHRTAVMPQAQSQASRIKIPVTQGGLYYLDASTIADLWGLSEQQVVGMVKDNLLTLSNQGNTVPTWPAKGGAGLIFYGQGIDSAYTKENIYWLYFGTGVRMQDIQGNGPAPASSQETFAETVHVEDDQYAVLSLFTDPNTNYWFSDYISLTGNPAYDKPASTFTFETEGLAGTRDPASIIINFQGFSSTGVSNEHHVRVTLNGTSIGEDAWEGAVQRTLVLRFAQGLLQNGENTLELGGVLDQGVDYSIFYIDSFDVTYPRLYEAVNNTLIFEADGNKTITVSGFTNPNILVFNITNPQKPQLIDAATIDTVAGQYRVSIAVPSGATQFLAVTDDAAVSPTNARARSWANLSSQDNGADYIVITPEELINAAQPLVDYRHGKGLATMVVNLEDIMDQFNYGISSPEAIHDFLKYAHTYWNKAPRYVVLAGQGNFDYKDNMGFGNNLIPTLMTGTPTGLAPSDNLFADMGTDHVPGLAIGRLPVLTADDLQGVIAKIKSYEKIHGNQILLLADNPDGAGDFPVDSNEIASLVPRKYSLQEIYLSNDPTDTARQLLMDNMNKGVALVNYIGHGGVGQLSQDGLLLNSDVATMNNRITPVMVAMTCLVGNFGIPGYDSLSELLVLKNGGGVSAIWSPTGMSFDSLSMVLDKNFFTGAFGGRSRVLGDLILESFQGYKGSGGPAYIIDIYNLQGDPAMKIW